jgi:hypothetical protein
VQVLCVRAVVAAAWIAAGCGSSAGSPAPANRADGGAEGSGGNSGGAARSDASTGDMPASGGALSIDAGAGGGSGRSSDGGASTGGVVQTGNGDAGPVGDAGPLEFDVSCSVDGWCWSNPAPIGDDFRAVLALSRTDVWAAGVTGTVLHYDGTKWSRSPQWLTKNIAALWASGPSDLWAVGGIGTLLHFDGRAWKDWSITSPVVSFSSAWGSAWNDVWAVGLGGAVYRFDGAKWTAQDAGTKGYFNAIWGSGPRDVWAAADDGFHHFDGSKWTSVANPVASTVYRLTGTSGHEVWAATSKEVLRFDGTSWKPAGSPAITGSINGIWSSRAGDVWVNVLGDFGKAWLLHWDGQGWTTLPFDPKGMGFTSLSGADPGEFWLVGLRGAMMRTDGITLFEPLTTSVTTWKLTTATTAADRDAWVGGGGARLHYSNRAWTDHPFSGYGPLTALWAAAPNDVLAFFNYPQCSYDRWNGSNWLPYFITDVPGCSSPNSVWGTNAANLYVAGNASVVGDGTTWSTIPGSSQVDVWGSGPDDVWLVGTYLSYAHWDGKTWGGNVNSSVNRVYWGVWSSGPADAWLVGDYGTIDHWDGQKLKGFPSPTSVSLRSVWGSSKDDVWIVGDGGLILHFQGSAWKIVASGTARTLNKVRGSSATDVWAVGDEGVVLHYGRL